MRSLVEKTGGYVVMSESFTGNIFKQSLTQVFSCDASGQYLRMAFGGTVEVLASNDFKVHMHGALWPDPSPAVE